MIDLAKATAAEFEATLNETWTMHDGGRDFPFTLVAVADLGEPIRPEFRRPFSITFRFREPLRVPQRIHRFTHERLGPIEIFVVQTSPTELQAVFN